MTVCPRHARGWLYRDQDDGWACLMCGWCEAEPAPEVLAESANDKRRHPERMHKGEPRHDAEMLRRILIRSGRKVASD